MDLQNIDNYEKIEQRYRAWLECEIIDRAPIWIEVVNNNSDFRIQKKFSSLREKWMDAEFQIECFEAWLKNKIFLADTVPIYMPNLGPDLCATLFGVNLDFGEDTSWSHPILKSCEEVLNIKPNFDNPYWKKIKEMTALSLERGRSRWFTGIADLHTNGDLLVGLRGPENLCLEVMDNPDAVRNACDYITDFFPRIYEDLYNPISLAGQPATTWCPALYKGKMYVTSCDFICLVSPENFKELILPGIIKEMKYLERSFFHLDGPAALRHLDILLELPKLNGIQWVYGVGNEPAAKWIEVYKKIQSAGKCIHLICDGIADAIEVSRHLRPQGVWFQVNGNHTKEEALRFVEYIEKWSAGKV